MGDWEGHTGQGEDKPKQDNILAGSISNALDRIDEGLHRLDDELVSLCSRLGPISVEQGDSEQKDPGEAMPPMSGVAERIHRQAHQLETLTSALRGARQRLDI